MIIRTIIAGLFLIMPQILSADFKPLKIVKDSLPNGMKIIYYTDMSAPVVSTVLLYKVGSKNEIPGQKGYAHFFEHLMFEGTENIQRASIDKYTEEAGGDLNAMTGFDETTYYFQVPSNEIKLPLWIESQRMRKLLVDSIGVQTQKYVVLEEMKQRLDNQPYGSMLTLMCENLFAGTNYSWTPIGSAEDIKKATIEDFTSFYNKYYSPENAILVVAGNFNIADVRNYVKDYFGPFPKGGLSNINKLNYDKKIEAKRKSVIDKKATVPALFLAYRCPDLLDSNLYSMQILNTILFEGKSSRLYKKLITDDELAVDISYDELIFQDAGAIIYSLIPSEDTKLSKLENALNNELDMIINQGISIEELNKAKNIIESKYITQNTDLLNIALNLASAEHSHGNPYLINTDLNKYKSVTMESVARVAKSYLSEKRFVVLNYLPEGYSE